MRSSVCNYLLVSIVCFALLWRWSIGGPVGARGSPLRLTGTCNELARSLLGNVSAVLEVNHLFSGFDCSQQNPEVHLRRQTVSACTPQQNSDCAPSAVLNIDENECLHSILEDLHYYRETFSAYSNPELTRSVVRSIDDLLQNCFSVSVMDISPAKVSIDHQKSFQERLQLCKVLKGFNLRTITINRVFNYILSK